MEHILARLGVKRSPTGVKKNHAILSRNIDLYVKKMGTNTETQLKKIYIKINARKIVEINSEWVAKCTGTATSTPGPTASQMLVDRFSGAGKQRPRRRADKASPLAPASTPHLAEPFHQHALVAAGIKVSLLQLRFQIHHPELGNPAQLIDRLNNCHVFCRHHCKPPLHDRATKWRRLLQEKPGPPAARAWTPQAREADPCARAGTGPLHHSGREDGHGRGLSLLRSTIHTTLPPLIAILNVFLLSAIFLTLLKP